MGRKAIKDQEFDVVVHAFGLVHLTQRAKVKAKTIRGAQAKATKQALASGKWTYGEIIDKKRELAEAVVAEPCDPKEKENYGPVQVFT